MSKHAYSATCECHRCRREHARRNAQAKADHARKGWPAVRLRNHGRTPRETRPAWGSQEWAETRGDDVGESPDY